MFGAIEHQVTMIVSNCNVDMKWVTDNWESTIFVLNQSYQRVCFLNHFEKILSLFHFIIANITELRSFNFKSFLQSMSNKKPKSDKMLTSETMVENLASVNIETRPSKVNKGSFITTLAKLNVKKTVWTNRRTSSQKLETMSSSAFFKEELLSFFYKALTFFFRAVEESVSNPSINYE